jgi:hypothetical protein
MLCVKLGQAPIAGGALKCLHGHKNQGATDIHATCGKLPKVAKDMESALSRLQLPAKLLISGSISLKRGGPARI